MPSRQGCQGKSPKMKDYPQYLILWKDFPPEVATWQWPVGRGVTGGVPRAVIDEYEAGLEAEAQLDAEEARRKRTQRMMGTAMRRVGGQVCPMCPRHGRLPTSRFEGCE